MTNMKTTQINMAHQFNAIQNQIFGIVSKQKHA